MCNILRGRCRQRCKTPTDTVQMPGLKCSTFSLENPLSPPEEAGTFPLTSDGSIFPPRNGHFFTYAFVFVRVNPYLFPYFCLHFSVSFFAFPFPFRVSPFICPFNSFSFCHLLFPPSNLFFIRSLFLYLRSKGVGLISGDY